MYFNLKHKITESSKVQNLIQSKYILNISKYPSLITFEKINSHKTFTEGKQSFVKNYIPPYAATGTITAWNAFRPLQIRELLLRTLNERQNEREFKELQIQMNILLF